MQVSKAPWAVCFKEVENDEIEYSVIRIDNAHGFKSWGWIEPDRKEVVACSRDADYKYPQFLKDRLKIIAVEYAKHLNESEGQPDFNVMCWMEEHPLPEPVVPKPLSEKDKILHDRFVETIRQVAFEIITHDQR